MGAEAPMKHIGENGDHMHTLVYCMMRQIETVNETESGKKTQQWGHQHIKTLWEKVVVVCVRM